MCGNSGVSSIYYYLLVYLWKLIYPGNKFNKGQNN